MSPTQIGFMKGKRTADHVFVLKCIIEEAKARHETIFSCFVDLKKAFDTVWREGLFYKLLFYYRVSHKYVRIFASMYEQLHGMVKVNDNISQTFPINIGLRQGCNLSPTLFNLYINDLPNILVKGECYPVSLNSHNINLLMYADDIVLLSTSKRGLQKALNILEIYCQKWQLVVNIKKTRVMILNSRTHVTFTYSSEELETVCEFKYLGVIIHKSGTFTSAIKDLSGRAVRAYCKIKSVLKGEKQSPRLFVKLFDTMVKPISLYCSEAWGGFSINKKHKDNILDYLLNKDRTPFENLNLRLCKQALKITPKASNLASRAELGRIPLAKSIIVAVLKYYARSVTIGEDTLLYHAFQSQKSRPRNSNSTLTFVQTADALLQQLGLTNLSDFLLTGQTTKDAINRCSKKVKDKCIAYYLKYVNDLLETGKVAPGFKLQLYAYLKKDYAYEKYLDQGHISRSELTKFRLSNHWLPIERERYKKNKPTRNKRRCILCNNALGNELHALLRCTHGKLLAAREKYLGSISNISCQMRNLNDADKLVYLLSGNDQDILTHLFKWLAICNATYKEAYTC